MPITNAQLLKYAFAQDGDRQDIAIDASPTNEVSWQQGYTNPYSLNPEADGKYILRPEFNSIIYMLSNAIRQTQIAGGMLWDANNANLINGYPAGSRVLAWLDLSTNQISQQPLKDSNNIFMSQTITLVSMMDGNIHSPFEEGNLFKYWWIDDGVDMFGLKILTQTPTSDYFKVPSGYLDLGDSEVTTKQYNLSDYPRVKYFTDRGQVPSYITDNGNGAFSFVDIRGRFPRLFSNGGQIDSGRTFATLQGDAIRNITGEAYQLGLNRLAYGTPESPFPTGFGYGSGLFAKTPIPTGEHYKIGRPLIADLDGVMPIAEENRPNNFNVKMYIKL